MNDQYKKIFGDNGLELGRMISASKTDYLSRHPDNTTVFNGNVWSQKLNKKVWWGDLDVTKSANELQKIADELDDELVVVYEMDGRFGKENDTFEQVKEKAVAVITPTK